MTIAVMVGLVVMLALGTALIMVSGIPLWWFLAAFVVAILAFASWMIVDELVDDV